MITSFLQSLVSQPALFIVVLMIGSITGGGASFYASSEYATRSYVDSRINNSQAVILNRFDLEAEEKLDTEIWKLEQLLLNSPSGYTQRDAERHRSLKNKLRTLQRKLQAYSENKVN